MRIALSLGLAALFLTATFAGADDKDKPKLTTKEVMKITAGKDKLLNKVTEGKGTDEDKKKILEAYQELAKNPPKEGKKGTPEEWKKLTTAIVVAAKDVVDGKEGSLAVLKKAGACGDCHNLFK